MFSDMCIFFLEEYNLEIRLYVYSSLHPFFFSRISDKEQVFLNISTCNRIEFNDYLASHTDKNISLNFDRYLCTLLLFQLISLF